MCNNNNQSNELEWDGGQEELEEERRGKCNVVIVEWRKVTMVSWSQGASQSHAV